MENRKENKRKRIKPYMGRRNPFRPTLSFPIRAAQLPPAFLTLTRADKWAMPVSHTPHSFPSSFHWRAGPAWQSKRDAHTLTSHSDGWGHYSSLSSYPFCPHKRVGRGVLPVGPLCQAVRLQQNANLAGEIPSLRRVPFMQIARCPPDFLHQVYKTLLPQSLGHH
jgi:hypothetical protein